MNLTETNFALFLEALKFAAERHRNQRRKDSLKSPYINHPIDVTDLVYRVGGARDLNILLAAMLHDTIEDTATRPEEIRELFGEEVLALVLELTDDKSLPKEERKRLQVINAPHKSPAARLIKLADKASNIRDITRTPPANWSLQRKREYLDWSEEVVDGIRGTNAALEDHYDQILAEGRAILDQEALSQ